MEDGLVIGGGIEILALPTVPVVPASAKRLFLLVTEGLGADESKECEGVRGIHAPAPAAAAGRDAWEESGLVGFGDGGLDEVGRDSGRSLSIESVSRLVVRDKEMEVISASAWIG